MAKSYKWKKKYSLGEIHNASFDATYRIYKNVLYGWDSTNSVYRAVKVNADGKVVVNYS